MGRGGELKNSTPDEGRSLHTPWRRPRPNNLISATLDDRSSLACPTFARVGVDLDVGVREMAGSFGVARSEGSVENVYSPPLKREE